MTEWSAWWTTSGTPSGHQVSSYTQAHLTTIAEILAACSAKEGVAPNYLNELSGSVPSANTARINTGAAVADGKVYKNDASVDVNIPSAVGGGNTRIDRIVVRVTWSSFQAVITRIAGTDAASPTPPAITQTPGATYDIKLYQALVNTSGTVTLTDERDWATHEVDGSTIETNAGALRVKDAGIIEAKLANLAVTLAKLGNDSVDDTKVGNRVPQFYRRQGGSASDWSASGTTNYTPTTIRMQAGIKEWTGAAADHGQLSISFPQAFSNVPLVFCQVGYDGAVAKSYISVSINTLNSSTVIVDWYNNHDATTFTSVKIAWFAVGPE